MYRISTVTGIQFGKPTSNDQQGPCDAEFCLVTSALPTHCLHNLSQIHEFVSQMAADCFRELLTFDIYQRMSLCAKLLFSAFKLSANFRTRIFLSELSCTKPSFCGPVRASTLNTVRKPSSHGKHPSATLRQVAKVGRFQASCWCDDWLILVDSFFMLRDQFDQSLLMCMESWKIICSTLEAHFTLVVNI